MNDIIKENNRINNPNNDQELLKCFVGNNFDKILHHPFNFNAFLFSTFYFFYRKMFIYGALLCLIISLIILSIIDNIVLIIIVDILFRIIIGLCANKIYLFYARKKINKIRLKNPQKSIQEIKNKCIEVGGTDILNIFVGIFIELGILLLIIIFIADKNNVNIPLLQKISIHNINY